MSQLGLLRHRRFWPLFVTQALGALNDNVFRNALIVLATFGIVSEDGASAGQLAAIATGLFILPYFLFSTLAGQLADRYDKAQVARIVKIWEIVLCAVAGVGFAIQSIPLLLFVLFMLGAQSTFFSPVKYSILPQHLKAYELLSGNAFIEAGTFLAILIGSILGSLLIDTADLGLTVSGIMMAAALVGYASARAIPAAPSADPSVRIKLNIAVETYRIIGFARQNGAVWWGILGIAWFWTLGGLYVSQLAPFTKSALGGDQTAVTVYLAMFSIGIGVGSLLCNVLLRGQVTTKYVPAAALGISIFATDMWFATRNAAPSGDLVNGLAVLADGTGLRIGIDLMLLAASAGLFSVPLYALVQTHSADVSRSRTIAAGNIIIASWMVAGALITTWLLGTGLRSQDVFALAAIVNVPAVGLLYLKLQEYSR
jgi:MFS family permease